jgi:hypothetical protein
VERLAHPRATRQIYPETVTRRVTWLRLSALLSAGTLALYELRYRAAYGRESEQALSEQGHA